MPLFYSGFIQHIGYYKTMQIVGRINDQDIQDLINQCDIVSEISEHVKLTKKGKYFWGRCPFHEEKTPSFKVDQEAQLYYCFGCHEGGNLFTFLSKTQNMTFIEAVEYLAGKHGVRLRRSTENKKYNKLERLYKLNEQGRKFFSSTLHSSTGEKALQYVLNRGFSDQIIREFDLGLAPKSEKALLTFLKKEGFSDEEAVACGLAKSSNGYMRDFFSARLIFPIRDMQGRVVAFGGRTLSTTGPKYLNTPETEIFIKNSTLYGFFQAKKEIIKLNCALITEGYTDVLALNQAGIKNCVATLGTALTVNHLKILNRFAEKIIIVFDGDPAGLSAAERVLELDVYTQNIYVISLPDNQDPADYIKNESLESFSALVENAKPLAGFCIDTALNRFPLDSFENKMKAANAAVKILHKIDDPIALSLNRKLLAEKLGIDEKSIVVKKKGTTPAKTSNAPKAPATDASEKAQREIIKIFLQHSAYLTYLDFLDDHDFQSPVYQDILTVLKKTGCGKKVNEIINEIENINMKNMIARLAVEEIESGNLDNLEAYCFALMNKLKELSLERKITDLKSRLQKMNPLKEIEYNNMFKKLIDLEAQKRDLYSANIGG